MAVEHMGTTSAGLAGERPPLVRPWRGDGRPKANRVDVLVVGGGPTGMTLAGDLARAGRSVVVMERRPQLNPSSRAFATLARTLEVLDARGLADHLLALGATTPAVNLGQGAGVDLTHLKSRYPFGLITPQANVDQALSRYAVLQGAMVLRGVEVTGLTQDRDGVSVTAAPRGSRDDTVTTSWRVDYVVGADGAHSSVRGMLDVDFPGTAVLSSVVLADVKLADGPDGGGLTLGSTPEEFGFLAPYGRSDGDGAWYRSMTWNRSERGRDAEPVEAAEIVAVLARTMGRDVGVVEVGWSSRVKCDERQVRRYRHGRVFLAGDAAHVHSPMTGQGMNTGIQDAANLAWKLDAVLGGADDAVLDSYQSERHPIGRRVLRQSGLVTRGVTLRPRVARALRDWVVRRVLSRPRMRDAIAGSFAGTELRYRAGLGRHRLVGTRATEVALTTGRVTSAQRLGGFLLIRERDVAGVAGPGAERVRHAQRAGAGPALLVRPDGYIAWVGNSGDLEGRTGWLAALEHWTGSIVLR